MRVWLPACVLAQGAGIVAVECGFEPFADLRMVALALLVLVFAASRFRRSSLLAASMAFFAIGAISSAQGRVEPGALPDWPVGVRRTLDARVREVRPTSGATRVELCGLAWPRPAGDVIALPGCVRLRVERDEPAFGFWTGRRPGDRVRTRLVLKPLTSLRNPGGRDRSAMLGRRGHWARATLAHPHAQVVVEARWAQAALPGGTGFHARREAAISRLVELGAGGRLLAALGLGASDRLEPQLRDAFARLGLSHLVAVSGLHLGMVAALGFSLMTWLARRTHLGSVVDPEPLSWIAAGSLAVGYAAASGFAAPARRALVFVTLLLMLHALGRRSAWSRAWWVAASLVLAADPAGLFDLGPQLSFAVTAALAAARFEPAGGWGPDASRTARLVQTVRTLFDASAIALSTSAIVLALHGRPVTVWSLAANIVAVPLTGACLLPGALVASLVAWLAPHSSWSTAVLSALAWWPSLFDTAVRGVADFVGPLPEPPHPAPAALMLAGLACFITLRATSAAFRAAAALACVSLLGWSTGPTDHEAGNPEVVAFDVGQGDALVIHEPGAAVLIDSGWASPVAGFDAGRHVVVPGLRALGVDHLDIFVLTHADLDHRGGAEAVLEQMPVDEVWVPQSVVDAPALARLRERAETVGAAWVGRAWGDAARQVGSMKIETLWPPRDHVPSSANESSLVLRIEAGGHRVLLMGDAGVETERLLLAGGADLRADILKVGHHGSATASSEDFLRAVQPRQAWISAGCGVGRALPNPATLERLSGGVERVRWTGRDGALRTDLGTGSNLERRGEPRSRRRCRFEAPAESGDHLDGRSRGPDRSSRGPLDSPIALPLWGGSRRVDAPRERRGRGRGRRSTKGASASVPMGARPCLRSPHGPIERRCRRR